MLITVVILIVLYQATREIYRRLMDAVDPALAGQAEQTLRVTPGVLGTGQVRLRWIGHQLRAEREVIVDADASAIEAPPDRRRRRARPAARPAAPARRARARRPVAQ
jgi:divalent metal cation (Fe/Co/Zn/Cd) transporter